MTTPIDLHDIAALLAYEQATTDPRFASVRLHEVSSSPDGSISFESARIKSEVLAADKRGVPATAWLFRKDEEAPTPTPKDHLARDPHASAAALKEDIDAQELVYHQSRSHDGCYKSIALLQHFFDLFPKEQPLLIRLPGGKFHAAPANMRLILEFQFQEPKAQYWSLIAEGATYSTGARKTMPHAIMGFGRPGEPHVGVALDMASLQLGETGWGRGGEPFRLTTMDAFYDWIETVAKGSTVLPGKEKGGAARIGPSPDDQWLKEVARRVKKRWERREEEPWCARCGAPEPKSRCACHNVRYCDARCAAKAWKGFHRAYCSARRVQ